MEYPENTNKPKKGLAVAIIAVVVVIALIVVAIIMQRNTNLLPEDNQGQEPTGQVDQNGNEGQNNNASTDINRDDLESVEVANVGTAKVVVPGANPITEDNLVITETGQVAQNDAPAMSENAPRQTGFLNEEELPENVVKLKVGNGVITPSEFTTVAGAPTTFSITGTDSFSHVVAFDDSSLSAVAMLVGPNQTKAITFQAPTEAGAYTFKCVSPGHSDSGEVGQMIVQ